VTEYTTIRIKRSTKELLEKLKVHPRQPIDEVLELLLKGSIEYKPKEIKHKASPTIKLPTRPRIPKQKATKSKLGTMTDCINFYNGECLLFRPFDPSKCNESCRHYSRLQK